MFHGLGCRVDDLSLDKLTICFFVKVNQMVINVFYPSLMMRIKVVSVNMKNCTLKMVSFDWLKTI